LHPHAATLFAGSCSRRDGSSDRSESALSRSRCRSSFLVFRTIPSPEQFCRVMLPLDRTRPRRSRPVCGMEVSVGAGRADASVAYAQGRSGEGRPNRALA
jgi:hypothetical protein